jgi:hypothetical protein
MKVHVGNKGIDAIILNAGIRWSPVVNLHPVKNPGTYIVGGWGDVRGSQDVSEKRKFPSFRGIRHPDCPTPSFDINRLTTERYVQVVHK